MTWRRLGVLVRHSRRGSAVHRVMDPEGVDWDVNSYLLANVVDALQASLWQRAGGKGHPPRPMQRPGPPGVRRITWEEKVALYEEHKRQRQRELEVMGHGR